MRIKIKNLGPIYEFNFDLNKDLHLVYGKNNIGKSHGIAAVYLILKNISEKSNFGDMVNILPNIVSNFVKKSESESNEKEIVAKEFRVLFTHTAFLFFNDILVPNLHKSFANSFENISNLENKFINENFSIELFFDFFDIKIGLDKDFILALKKVGMRKYINLEANDEPFSEKPIIDVLNKAFKEILTVSNAIYFLPASRSGLYQGMNATAPILADISRIRHLLSNKTYEIPSFSEPVADYFLQLISVNPNGKSDAFNRIAEKIENDILQGTIVFNNQNRKYEYVQHRTNMRLEVTSASSMISELAPFVAFLKYILKEDKNGNKTSKCLFIEEPEAHLHPSVQVVLMQLFTEMANNGVKVIMTTHSDFMFNELGNLILDNKIKAEQVSSMHLVMTEKGSIDKGDMQATEDGIDDYNFSEVAENQYERRMNLLDLKNQ